MMGYLPKYRAVAAHLLIAAALLFFPALGSTDEAKFDMVLVLDLSGSMGNVYKNRQNENVFQWVKKMGRPEDRIGVITFGKSQKVEHRILPFLDFSPEALGQKTKKLSKYTNVAAGLEQAYYLLTTEARPETGRVILLFSDGRIDLPGGKGAEKESKNYLRTVLIPAMKREKVRLFAFVPETLQADYPLLQEWAELTSGRYFRGLPPDSEKFRADHLPPKIESESPPVAAVQEKPKPPKTQTVIKVVEKGNKDVWKILVGGAIGVVLIILSIFTILRPILRSRHRADGLADILDDIRVLRQAIAKVKNPAAN